MGLFSRRKLVGRGVFGRQLTEDETPELIQQFVLILDDVWETKVEEPSLPYHSWWDSRQKQFHQICLAAVRDAVDNALSAESVTLDDTIMEHQAGRYLADVLARPDEVLDEMGLPVDENSDAYAKFVVSYQDDVYPLAVALVDRYSITDNEDRA